MKCKSRRDDAPVRGFIPLEEFPVSELFKEEVMRLTGLAKSGEGYGSDEDDIFEGFVLDFERRITFPTQEELKRLPSWKSTVRKHERRDGWGRRGTK
jgi:hypothetical protein